MVLWSISRPQPADGHTQPVGHAWPGLLCAVLIALSAHGPESCPEWVQDHATCYWLTGGALRGRPADGAGVDRGDVVADCALDALRAPGVHKGDLAAPAYEMPHLVCLHQGAQHLVLVAWLAAVIRVGMEESSVPDARSRQISYSWSLEALQLRRIWLGMSRRCASRRPAA